MNKISRFFACLPSMFLCGALSLCGCMGGSGTEVGNPATVSGKVRDIQNTAIANAVVFLVTPDYNAVLDSIASLDSIGNGSGLNGLMIIEGATQRVSTQTNDQGEFVFDSVVPRAYNLFITDSSVHRINFRPRIIVGGGTVDLGVFEIRTIGYATITVPDSVFEPNSYISLPGTPIKKAIDSAGQYTVPIIYDSMTINYYGKSGDSLSTIINNQSIPTVNSGDTIDLTGIETIIIPPVLVAIIASDTLFPSIDSIGDHDTLITIVALGATINKNSTLEYQFYEATRKTLSAWSADNSYLLEIGERVEYSVSCRVRSKSNTSIVTAWTSGFLIKMLRTPDSIGIPVPSVPVPLDTFGFVDSILYRFLIYYPNTVDSALYEYRLRWSSDMSNGNGVSLWQQKSMISILFPESGTYTIKAQARSVVDTMQMSLWSDSLLFTVGP